MTATLTRQQFDEACQEFIHAHQSISSAYEARLSGWSWKEHHTLPGFGYMHRIITLNWRHPASVDTFLEIDGGLDVVDDGTTASHDSPDSLTCHQFVVLSATFRVPTFYFSIHASSGSPLQLTDIMKTSLLREDVCEGTVATTFAVSHPATNFPFLSQGEHPTARHALLVLSPMRNCKCSSRDPQGIRRNQQETAGLDGGLVHSVEYRRGHAV
ncbi:hypothetical protein EV702DRAFT_1086534, partial [Suillus placidus]